MRVLHVTSSLDPIAGGVANAVANMARSQAAAGLKVSVVGTWVTHPGTDVAEALRGQGVGVELIRARDPRSQHPQLRQMMDERVRAADVVHVHAMWEEIQHRASRACQAAGVPYVLAPHGMLDPWNMTHGTWKKRLYVAVRMRRNLNRAAALHFTTEIERRHVARFGFAPRAIVEPLGIDVAGEFRDLPGRGFLRNRFPQIGGRRVVLYLGRIHSGKGLELLVPAFAKARTADDVLVIAGPDSDGYEARVRESIRSAGVEADVLFTGMLRGADRVAALVDADLFCLPSYHENFGVSVVEALAAGAPVIVSDQVGLHPDITAARVGGVVPLDAGALADEMRSWLGDEPRRREAGARGRAFVLERFDWSNIAARWAGHYRAIVAGRRPQAEAATTHA